MVLDPAMVALLHAATERGCATQFDASHGLGLCWRQGVLLPECFSVFAEDIRNGHTGLCITWPCRRLRTAAGAHVRLFADVFPWPQDPVQKTMLLPDLGPGHVDIPVG